MTNVWRCSGEEAEKILSHLDSLGLRYCKKQHENSFGYDLLEFAFMQQYVCPEDSFFEGLQKMSTIQKKTENESNEITRSYKKEYGTEEKWSEEIWDKYEQEERKNQGYSCKRIKCNCRKDA